MHFFDPWATPATLDGSSQSLLQERNISALRDNTVTGTAETLSECTEPS